MGRAPGRWWGMAPLGPEATIVSKLVPSAPEPADLGVELEAELLLGRAVHQPGHDAARAASAMSRGGLDAGHLAGVLHQPELVDQALGGHELGAVEPVVARSAAAAAHVTWSASSPSRATPSAAGDDRVLLAQVQDLDAGVHAGRGDLLGRPAPRSGRR